MAKEDFTNMAVQIEVICIVLSPDGNISSTKSLLGTRKYERAVVLSSSLSLGGVDESEGIHISLKSRVLLAYVYFSFSKGR